MISKGRLFLQYQWLKNRQAMFSAVGVVIVGTICMSELRQSVRVMMQSYPLSSGSGPMKSIVTESHHSSGTGKG